MRAWENDTVWENKRTVWCKVPSQRTQNAQESLGAAQKTASQEEAQEGGEGDEMQPGGQTQSQRLRSQPNDLKTSGGIQNRM